MNRSKVYPLAAGIDQLLNAAEDAAAVLGAAKPGSELRELGDALSTALAGLGVSRAGPKRYEPGVAQGRGGADGAGGPGGLGRRGGDLRR